MRAVGWLDKTHKTNKDGVVSLKAKSSYILVTSLTCPDVQYKQRDVIKAFIELKSRISLKFILKHFYKIIKSNLR